MSKKTCPILLATLAMLAGFAYMGALRRHTPPDFRDAVAEKTAAVQLGVESAAPIPEPAPEVADKGRLDKKLHMPSLSKLQIEYVSFPGGEFVMGTPDEESGFKDSKPAHRVKISPFKLAKAPVTVAQYEKCVRKGACTAPDKGEGCNYGKFGRGDHPINCLDWYQASQYAKFAGGRLPTEAEWEYAARGAGNNRKYPWGNEVPTCARVVMYGEGGDGCGKGHTMPVCSKPEGNTPQGLCDMAGNVYQWVQDVYRPSYAETSADTSGKFKVVMRGGSWDSVKEDEFRVDYRGAAFPGFRDGFVGVRVARSK